MPKRGSGVKKVPKRVKREVLRGEHAGGIQGTSSAEYSGQVSVEFKAAELVPLAPLDCLLEPSASVNIHIVEGEPVTHISSIRSSVNCVRKNISSSEKLKHNPSHVSKPAYEATECPPFLAEGCGVVAPDLIVGSSPSLPAAEPFLGQLCLEPQQDLGTDSSLHEKVLKSCFEPVTLDELDPVDSEWSPNRISNPQEDSSEEDQQQHHCDLLLGVNGSDLLYENAPITVMETLIATLTLILTENLNSSTFGRLLHYASLLIPKPNMFCSSPYLFYQSLETHDSPVKLYFYCTACYKSRNSAQDLCDSCVTPNKSVNFFIHFLVREQLQRKFQSSKFVEGLKYKDKRVKRNINNIEDIYDTEVYKNFENNPRFLGKKKISLGWNQDGVSPFNCSTYSLTPFYLVVNELSPANRFKKENVILAGLWGGKEKPHPNIFLKPIYDEIESLRSEGLDTNLDGEDVNVVCDVIWGTCDAPAKACFFNLKGHGGYFSCPKCLIEGLSHNNALVFPHQQDLELRSDDTYLRTVSYAIENRHKKNKEKDKNFAGWKGATLLSFVVTDMIKSTGIDYMHAVHLGVTKQLLKLWFDPCYSTENFSLSSNTEEVNERLLCIKLPHFVQRDLVPVDKTAFMKSSVLRNFLNHAVLPIMSQNILKEDYFNHLKLLVTGIALLSSDSVSREDIEIADALLCKFVADFQVLYGLRHMSFNIHELRHLARCVLETGNLCLTSCYAFEGLNGDILSLVHGTRHAGLQVSKGIALLSELPEKIVKLPQGPAKDFCEKLTSKFKRLKINEAISSEMFTVGKYSRCAPSTVSAPGKNVLSFTRLWKNGILYAADDQMKGSRVSSVIRYDNDGIYSYGQIKSFVKFQNCTCLPVCSCAGEYFAIITEFQTTDAFCIEYNDRNISIPHIKNFVSVGNIKTVHVDKLSTVCFNSVMKNQLQFLSVPLNTVELE